jgi:hypothetical protein
MGNQLTFDNNNIDNYNNNIDKNDRIVEINGFKLFVHDNIRLDRRNVICYSNKLQTYITLNNLKNDNRTHVMKIGDLIYKNTFDDIKVITVKGYF